MPEFRRPMRLGEALYSALTGKSPRSEGKTTMQRTRDLVRHLTPKGGTLAQGKKLAAQALGVSLRTVQRRFNGEQEAKNDARGNRADDLERAQRAARVTPGRAAKFTGSATRTGVEAGAGGLTLKADVRVSEDEREGRVISPGKYIPAGELDRVVELIASQGPEAAEAELNRLISTHYVPGMHISNVEWIEYD